jgi:hypothetical protein
MKKILLLFCFSLIFSFVYSQSTFDNSLNEVSADIAAKLSQKGKKKIVVLYVTDIDKTQTVAGKYIADVISVNIVNDPGNFEVFDRENLSGITEAKKLIAEGYIDANKAKELGKLLAVETIIIGNYTVLSSTMKLTLKVLDVNNGFVIAASMKDLPINADAGTLLGINVGSTGNSNISNDGFNGKPLNSNENYNNPETVNKDCETKKTGDYCFQNNTKYNLNVGLITTPGNYPDFTCTLQPGQKQCFYDLRVGSARYLISSGSFNAIDNPSSYYSRNSNLQDVFKANGQIYIEQCKSKTFVIK